VSIKQAYGFVQFHDVAACHTALEREQGQEVRGRKMRKFLSLFYYS
jgi:nuclear polyadenylated RNA-binding protein 3